MQKLTIQQLSFSNVLNLPELKAKFQQHQLAQGLTAKTRRDYDYHLTAFLSITDSIRDCTPDLIRDHLATIQQQGLSVNTARGRYRVLNTFFNFLIEGEYIEHHPMNGVKPPRKPNIIQPALSIEEVMILNEYFKGKTPFQIRNRAIWLVMMDTGLRLQEVADLKVGQADLVTGILKVRGKGNKDRYVRLGNKSLEALARWCKGREGTDGDPLWLGRVGPLTSRGIDLIYKRASVVTGVKVRSHKVRRTAALMMLRSGMNLAVLSKCLGHASLETTQLYLDLDISDLIQDHELHSPADQL